MTVSTHDKISHAKTYMEPDLYSLAQRTAQEEGETMSSWLRKLILKALLERNKLTPDMILKLAEG